MYVDDGAELCGILVLPGTESDIGNDGGRYTGRKGSVCR